MFAAPRTPSRPLRRRGAARRPAAAGDPADVFRALGRGDRERRLPDQRPAHGRRHRRAHRRLGANLLVALGSNPELDIWSRVAGLRERCPRLRRVLAVGGTDRALGADDFDAVLAAQPGDALTFDCAIRADTLRRPLRHRRHDRRPKLARHSHGNQLHSAWSAAQMYAMNQRDVVINGFPLFHVAGSIVDGLSTLLSGAEIVLPTLLGMRNARFVPRYWDVVERHRVTFLAVVPTILSTLLGVDPKDADITSVRAAFTGGSPLPPELAAAFEARFRHPVRNILGMTECAGVVSIEPFLDVRRPGSAACRCRTRASCPSPATARRARRASRACCACAARRRPRIHRRTARSPAPLATTAGSSAATSATSTRTASSSSPAAPRTSSSAARTTSSRR